MRTVHFFCKFFVDTKLTWTVNSFKNCESDVSDLQICPVQREIFDDWKRPSEILGHHTSGSPILLGPNPMDLVQDVTTDCSVVASLCTGASLCKEGVSQVLSMNTTF